MYDPELKGKICEEKNLFYYWWHRAYTTSNLWREKSLLWPWAYMSNLSGEKICSAVCDSELLGCVTQFIIKQSITIESWCLVSFKFREVQLYSAKTMPRHYYCCNNHVIKEKMLTEKWAWHHTTTKWASITDFKTAHWSKWVNSMLNLKHDVTVCTWCRSWHPMKDNYQCFVVFCL